MPHNVRTNIPLVQLPKGSGTDTQRIETSGTTVLLTDDEYNRLPAAAFTVDVTDLGYVAAPGSTGAVTTQAAHVSANPAAVAVAAAGATPTKAEYDTLLADVAALRTTLNALLAALSGTGKPMA